MLSMLPKRGSFAEAATRVVFQNREPNPIGFGTTYSLIFDYLSFDSACGVTLT